MTYLSWEQWSQVVDILRTNTSLGAIIFTASTMWLIPRIKEKQKNIDHAPVKSIW